MTFNYTYNYPQVARESGFKLRNYKDGPLDWRLIGNLGNIKHFKPPHKMLLSPNT